MTTNIQFKVVAFNDILCVEEKIAREAVELITTLQITKKDLVWYFVEKYGLIPDKITEIIDSRVKYKEYPSDEGYSYLYPASMTLPEWIDKAKTGDDSYLWIRHKVRLSGPFARGRKITSLAMMLKGQNPYGMNLFGWMLAQSPVVLEGTIPTEILGQVIQIPRLSSTQATLVDEPRHVYDVFNSNDYVGLRVHPKVLAACIRATLLCGNGSGGSRLISGTTPFHVELERVISEFKGTEATIVFNTGYETSLAMASVFFSGKESIIFSDAFNHASIIDGTQLARSQVFVFKHNDINDLVRVIDEVIEKFGKKVLRQSLLFIESVYSMDGDIAKLAEIVDVAKYYGLVLGVDEAHSTLAIGNTGRGICEHLTVPHDNIDLLMGTLSKAVGAEGGSISAKREIVDVLKLLSRQFWFSTAQTPAAFAGAAESFKVIQEENWRIQALAAKSARVRAALKQMGYNIGTSETHIIPVIIGEQVKTAMLSAMLKHANILAGAVYAPAVPEGQERIRLSISADHTDEQIAGLLEVFNQAKQMILGAR